MLLIPCPYCGPRSEEEFSYGNEAHVPRPKEPEKLSDAQWAEFVFIRSNVNGVYLERWFHSPGCRRWCTVSRDTVSYEIPAVYATGARPPHPERRRPFWS